MKTELYIICLVIIMINNSCLLKTQGTDATLKVTIKKVTHKQPTSKTNILQCTS